MKFTLKIFNKKGTVYSVFPQTAFKGLSSGSNKTVKSAHVAKGGITKDFPRIPSIQGAFKSDLQNKVYYKRAGLKNKPTGGQNVFTII
jgi:hypothetical protein